MSDEPEGVPMLVMPRPCPWRRIGPFDGIDSIWLVATPIGRIALGSVSGAMLWAAFARARSSP